MTNSIYHQCGHNHNWNKESLVDDECGAGLIISPIHQNRNSVEKISKDIRAKSFFDPQFYIPNSQKNKLSTYDFFPETISNGFITTDFSLLALESATKCVDFQIQNEFSSLIIPARHFSEMIPDYADKQEVYTVNPFLQAINTCGYEGDVYLTLPITKGMLMNDYYRVGLLNWITSFQRLDGIYLIVEDDRNTKQIRDSAFLMQYLLTVRELINVGLKVVVSHLNTEGLLFSLVEGCDVTFGAYENTRIFSSDKFIVSDEERRGPKARIYVSGLLNWIDFAQARDIKTKMGVLWEDVYMDSEYGDQVLQGQTDPHFNTPNLYKHYFSCFSNQFNELISVDLKSRHSLLRAWLKQANEYYEQIEDFPMDLERHGQGTHIQPWLDTINWYYQEFIS